MLTVVFQIRQTGVDTFEVVNPIISDKATAMEKEIGAAVAIAGGKVIKEHTPDDSFSAIALGGAIGHAVKGAVLAGGGN